MFDNMQITVMGGGEEEKSNNSYVSDDNNESDGNFSEDEHFKEDLNKISQKHQKFIDLEERDKEDMDFPDEVDTPFKEARKRF
jgi:hypothetical protein